MVVLVIPAPSEPGAVDRLAAALLPNSAVSSILAPCGAETTAMSLIFLTRRGSASGAWDSERIMPGQWRSALAEEPEETLLMLREADPTLVPAAGELRQLAGGDAALLAGQAPAGRGRRTGARVIGWGVRFASRLTVGRDPRLFCAPWYLVKKRALLEVGVRTLGRDVIPRLLAQHDCMVHEPASNGAATATATGFPSKIRCLDTYLRTIEVSLSPRSVPRLLRIALLVCILLALAGFDRQLDRYTDKAWPIIANGALLRSAWPVPTDELRRVLPPVGCISFATDADAGEALQRHGHLQNRLAPLIVLREAADSGPPPETTHAVLKFYDRRRETAFCTARCFTVTARFRDGFAVAVRKP